MSPDFELITMFRNPKNWIVKDKIVFQHDCEKGHGLEDFQLVKKRKKRFSIKLNVVHVKFLVNRYYTWADILLGLGFRTIAIIGKGTKSEFYRVMCRSCRKVQIPREFTQKCSGCKRKFYIFEED